MILDIFTAIFYLGIPVCVTSWWLVRKLYQSGRISGDTGFHTLREQVHDTKKQMKAAREEPNGYLETNWMKFGGGFYGITALTTYWMIESGEVLTFIFNFPGLSQLLDQESFP